MWPKEVIPDESGVLMRVHKNCIPDGEIRPNIFREQEGALSVDWDKYATPEDTRSRGRSPADNGVVCMNVGAIRVINSLTVEHDPVQEGAIDERGAAISPNRAHSVVFGVGRDPERRVALSRICIWMLRF